MSGAVRRLDENGLPVIDVAGDGVTFRLNMSIKVREHDSERYAVQYAFGAVQIVPKALIDRRYVRWNGEW